MTLMTCSDPLNSSPVTRCRLMKGNRWPPGAIWGRIDLEPCTSTWEDGWWWLLRGLPWFRVFIRFCWAHFEDKCKERKISYQWRMNPHVFSAQFCDSSKLKSCVSCCVTGFWPTLCSNTTARSARAENWEFHQLKWADFISKTGDVLSNHREPEDAMHDTPNCMQSWKRNPRKAIVGVGMCRRILDYSGRFPLQAHCLLSAWIIIRPLSHGAARDMCCSGRQTGRDWRDPESNPGNPIPSILYTP